MYSFTACSYTMSQPRLQYWNVISVQPPKKCGILFLFQYTELTSGPRTIMFRESFQPGMWCRHLVGVLPVLLPHSLAHTLPFSLDELRREGTFRISILSNGRECVLLDRVPNNGDSSKNYTITVMIPDFECRRPRCTLLVQKFGEWMMDPPTSLLKHVRRVDTGDLVSSIDALAYNSY